MQPSSLGYGSESDLARVLISCGQVANSSFGGSGRPLRPDNFCGGRAVRRSGLRAGAVTSTADGRFRRHNQLAVRQERSAEANGRPMLGPQSGEGRTHIS